MLDCKIYVDPLQFHKYHRLSRFTIIQLDGKIAVFSLPRTSTRTGTGLASRNYVDLVSVLPMGDRSISIKIGTVNKVLLMARGQRRPNEKGKAI